MKALKIALFACVFSVFFSFTALADTITTQNIQPGETVTAHLTTWIGYNNPTVDHVAYGSINLRLNNYGAFKLLGASVTSVSSNGPSFQGSGAITSQNETSASGVLSGSWNVNYNGTTYIYVNVEATVQNISSYADSAIFVLSSKFNGYGNDGPSNITINNNINAAQNKLDAILSALDSPVSLSDYLGPDAIVYFDTRDFDSCSNSSSSNGLFHLNSGATSFNPYNSDNSIALTIQPGNYYLVLGVPGNANSLFDGITEFNFFGSGVNPPTTLVTTSSDNNYFFVVYSFHIDTAVSVRQIWITFKTPLANGGLVTGGIIPFSDDQNASMAMNPQQDNKNNELNSEANKQSQQEQQLWQNVNIYKSQLDFGLNSWSDAADGLDYVTDVFLLIWNNSPTQIITLSLMLGIGMLAIGRGVMAARRQAKDDT